MTSSPKSPVTAAQTANISNGKSEKYPELTAESPHPYVMEIIWRNVLVFIGLHVAALYGLLLFLTAAKVATLVWGEFITVQRNNDVIRVVEIDLVFLVCLWAVV